MGRVKCRVGVFADKETYREDIIQTYVYINSLAF